MIKLNGEQIKAILDTGNSTQEAIALSENQFKNIKGQYSRKMKEEIRTAKKGANWASEILGIPNKYIIQPAIYEYLSDPVNVGVQFLEKIGAKFDFD